MGVLKAEDKVNPAKCVDTLFSLANTLEGSGLVKIILNYVAKTSPSNSELRNINADTFEDISIVKKYINIALNSMIEATKEEEKFFSTGDLAKYFGVSITSINKWIDNDRFEGVERTEKNKQIRISENTRWKSRKGEYILIKEIVGKYEEKHFTEKEEINSVLESIKFFEEKYKGDFETVSERFKKCDNISAKDEACLREWEYLISILK